MELGVGFSPLSTWTGVHMDRGLPKDNQGTVHRRENPFIYLPYFFKKCPRCAGRQWTEVPSIMELTALFGRIDKTKTNAFVRQ